MSGAEDLIFRLVMTLVPLILAIAVHEFAHVAMARWLGDDTGTRLGRFTLNPLAHMDPIWTLGVPAMLVVFSGGGTIPFFAAGKPAPYTPRNLDRHFRGQRISLRTAEMLVALAGPASNVVLALISGALAFVAVRAGATLEPQSIVWLLVLFFSLNVALAVFNLIPIPPLDGSKIAYAVLPSSVADSYAEVAHRLSFALIAAVLLGGRFIVSPVVRLAEAALQAVLF